ncbi:hypothetical protein D0Y65_052978, partial [Glycine soja]
GCTITCILWGPFAMQLKAWTSVKTTLNLWLSYYTWPKSKNLKVTITHQQHTFTFVLWNKEATQLINQSAADLKKQLIQNEGKFDPKSMPKALDNVLKKQLAFKIKIVPNSSCYSVLETSQD